MAYPFVQAAADYGPRTGPTRAFVIHLAEGGGTVGFLSRPNNRGVSVHYVIEYSGRIVQMLRENRVSGSINPNDIRTTDGPEPYGATAAKAVLGAWWGNPNQAVLSVEIEGFAKDGPNDKQKVALKKLVDDIRTRYPSIGLLGHRDFADYKACPGRFIPWAELGGHGPANAQEPADMGLVTHLKLPLVVGVATIPAGIKVIRLSDAEYLQLDAQRVTEATGIAVRENGNVPGYLIEHQGGTAWVNQASVTFVPNAAPAPSPAPSPTVLQPGIYEVKP